jgi:competence protein ComEC
MSETGGPGPRVGRRAVVLGGGRAAAGWAERAGDLLALVAEWLAAASRLEADAGRLAPWLAVAFGIGILLYFGAPSEPSLYAAPIPIVLCAVVAWVSRERPFAFALSLALVAAAAGFAAGCLRGALVAHPLLTRTTGVVTVRGFVEARDSTERSDRIVLRVTSAHGSGAEHVSASVRVALRRGYAPRVGEHVEVLVRLQPLLGPVRPGGFDFQRNGYFAGLGASGYVLGRPKATTATSETPLDIRLFAAIENLRRAMADRIRAVLPGESGVVAAALVTGLRDDIPPEVNESMRVSGLYHVLSISGLHMALVVGAFFALVRGGLALVPGFALRRPIKKWAASAALAGAAGYLVLSGAAVATQRAFLMIAVVLIGVLIDRPALTVRTLATAAVVVLAFEPEAVLHPSFQMSFAATVALVALFEQGAPMLARPPTAGSGAFGRLTERIGRWLLLGAATSFAAGLATAVYAAFHFHRVAPYGVLANVLTMPVLSLVIMPAGLVSVLLQPFGYDALGWKMMGGGIDVMLAVARWVAELPGAEGRVRAFGGTAVLIASAGILLLALPVSKLRFLGVPVVGIAAFLAISAPRPDVLVDASGTVIAVRGGDGRLSILDARRGRIAAESWLAADADDRKAGDGLASAFACDASRCNARLADGTAIVVARRYDAVHEACRAASLVITRLFAQDCRAPVIDGNTLATTGAVALRRVGDGWRAEAARSPIEDRPWFGRARPPDPMALERIERTGLAAKKETSRPRGRIEDVPTPEPPEDQND